MTQHAQSALPAPDDLLATWQALVDTGAHVHLPHVAAHAKVPEAALLAARIGTGATRLLPDLAKVLAPICEWHRVMLVASTGLGVFMPLDHIENFTATETEITLSGASLLARIDLSLVGDVYLFIETDAMHGTTKSIQAFDHAGAPLLKVIIFHKTSFRAAQEWTNDLVHPDQSRSWVPTITTTQAPEAALTPTDLPAKGFTQAIEKAVDSATPVAIRATRTGVEMNWTGTLTVAKRGGPMLHLHESNLRGHLNLSNAVTAPEGSHELQVFVADQTLPALEILNGGTP